MKSDRIAWVLMFMALLVVGHLILIYIDLWACYDLLQGRIKEQGYGVNLNDTVTCGSLEEVYQKAVNQYLSIALALATGGAVAHAAKKDGSDGES